MSTQSIQIVPAPWGASPSWLRREKLWKKAGGKCYWCKCDTRMLADNSWDKATIDHVVPRYKGGSDDDSNCVLSCNRCNNRRNYEDIKGLAEGELLGKFKEGQVVSGDKKAYVSPVKPSELVILRSDRDRLLQELIRVRDKIKAQDDAYEARGKLLRHAYDELAKKDVEIKAMTVWGLVKLRLADWLLTSSRKSD